MPVVKMSVDVPVIFKQRGTAFAPNCHLNVCHSSLSCRAEHFLKEAL